MSVLGRQSSPPAILAFSLFTNDGPRSTAALEAAVRATASRPGACVVWATIVRPPLDGVSYDAANTLLRRLANDRELAGGLQLVDWAAQVARSPSLVAGDGVHGTPTGYRVLARLYASAISSCAGAR
jgi:lysophospholipase L1-like esterase